MEFVADGNIAPIFVVHDVMRLFVFIEGGDAVRLRAPISALVFCQLNFRPVRLLVVSAGFDSMIVHPAFDVVVVFCLIDWVVSIDGFVGIVNFGIVVVNRSRLFFEVAIAKVAIADNLFVAADNDRAFMSDLIVMVNNVVIMVYLSLGIDRASAGRNAPIGFSYGTIFFDDNIALPVYVRDGDVALIAVAISRPMLILPHGRSPISKSK